MLSTVECRGKPLDPGTNYLLKSVANKERTECGWYSHFGGFQMLSLVRLTSVFTDGVFSIVATLIVLDLTWVDIDFLLETLQWILSSVCQAKWLNLCDNVGMCVPVGIIYFRSALLSPIVLWAIQCSATPLCYCSILSSYWMSMLTTVCLEWCYLESWIRSFNSVLLSIPFHLNWPVMLSIPSYTPQE